MTDDNQESLIQIDAVEKQIEEFPVQFRKDPFVQNLLKNKALTRRIADIASQQMEVNLEDVIVTCGDMFFHPVSKKSEVEAELRYSKLENERICHGESPVIIHFHGPYPGFLSERDDRSNKEHFFPSGVPLSCAVGIDGIHCRTRQWRYLRMPWTDAFYDKIKKEKAIPTLKNVRSVRCEPKERKKGQKEIFCEIEFMNGRDTFKDIFNEVGSEYYKNYEHVYASMNDKKGEMYPIYNIFKEEGVYCSVFERNAKGKSRKKILTCFKHLI